MASIIKTLHGQKSQPNQRKFQSIDAMFVKGTCMKMCPDGERSLREKERLLHPFEKYPATNKENRLVADPNRIVKQFSRPAAGQKPPQPSDIRPIEVLDETVKYLFNQIVPMNNVDWIIVYDFVFDRLRAVRQDMVMQGLTARCIPLFEAIIRFHAYAAYRLCEKPISKFDPVINRNHLLECLKSLLVLYDEEGNIETRFEHRSEMETLYLVLNLGDTNALYRAYHLNSKIRTALVNTGIQISLASLLGNFVRVCKLMVTLPLLLACTAALHLPSLRRHALLVMSTAYNSKNGVFPISKLQAMLLYNSEIDVLEECKVYNIKRNSDTMVLFLKEAFNINAKPSPVKPSSFVDKRFKTCNISDLVLGCECKF